MERILIITYIYISFYWNEGSDDVSKRQLQAYLLMSLILIIVVTLTMINYNTSKEYVLKTVEKETNQLLTSFTDETNEFSTERVAELELIAKHIVHVNSSELEMVEFLREQRQNMPFFTSLGFITPEGEILAGDGSRFSVNDYDSFKRALTGDVVFSDLFPLFQDPTQIVTAIRLPVEERGEIVGVLSGVVNMGNILDSRAEESNLPGTLYLFKNNELVYSTSDEPFQGKVPYADQIVNEMQIKEEGSILVNKDTAHFVMYRQAGDDWTVLVDSFNHDLEKHISAIFWRNTLIVAVTFLILCGILLYIRRTEVREDHMLKRDLLTNLPNRIFLEERLEKYLNPSGFQDFTLLFINIDRFKEINERNGYQIGDRLLFEISNKMRAFSGRDELYRVGGDEFVIIVPTNEDQELKAITDQIIKLMEEPVELSSYASVWITMSLGIRKSEIGDWSDLMMQDATFAVQEAKKQGGNRAVFFSQTLANQNERSRLIANNVVYALQNNEYYMAYQPIYELATQEVKSYEALLRWESPLIGSVGPNEFIPLLEDNDLIIPVGRWIVREVALQMKRWEQDGHTEFTIAINISVKQMMHPDFMKDIKHILEDIQVSPNRLIFEITETVAVQNIDMVTSLLGELNEYGIQIALDDFGTGFSSLFILKSLPIQHVKIDRSFIVSMENEGEKSRIILQGILDIARNLGMTTVMEGVETEEQLYILKAMGAQKIQGYLISPPMIANHAMGLYQKQGLY